MPSTKSELSIDMNVSIDNYSIYILYNHKVYENMIFQLYEKDANKRIGWIFPIQAILSKEHSYYDNQHFLRYASAAYQKLSNNDVVNHPNSERINIDEEVEILDVYSENSVLVVLSNSEIESIDGFDFDNYYPIFYLYGLGKKENDFLEFNHSSSEKRLTIQKVSEEIKDEIFLNQLFQEVLLVETNRLVQFYLLYQVIELLIEKVFQIEANVLFMDLKETEKQDLFEVKSQFNELLSEKTRLQLLFSKYSVVSNDTKSSLQEVCNRLLTTVGKKETTTVGSALYNVRSFLVHNYRSLPSSKHRLIEDINGSFKEVIVEILTTVNGISTNKVTEEVVG